MKNLSNQTIQLVGSFVLALVVLGFIGGLACAAQPIPEILDRAAYLIFGSFLGVGAVNGIRKVNGGSSHTS